ncbi:hypothetical protein HGRIS_012194 [Hohenbuehelia grisea]|uniref:Alginate lyase domain-containing protein n=1 Tax=Hohenbuehelia grisea TaxID=104357 RepID=A0ABR3IRN5_9AGAR
MESRTTPTLATTALCRYMFYLLALLALAGPTSALTSYANDFVDPDYILAGNYGPNSQAAQRTIVSWARELALKGPWTVTSKNVSAPTGDRHTYMSWAPYWWPNCTSAGNTTELAAEEVWTTCPYESRDGLFNPDGRLINDVGNFQDLSDAVLYNSIAHALSNSSSSEWSKNAVNFVRTWFLDEETRMLPNLDYAQMIRGPGDRKGSRTGVLDLKGMTKITSGLLILRKGNSSDWTPDLDGQMNAWTKEYITWLETATNALEEGASANNHGTFYYNQLAALYLLVDDHDGARNVTDTYFRQQYMTQIEANGEQPLEAARTRPYHYRAYNLAAMITNARISRYASPSGPNPFELKTEAGSTIQTALDFAIETSASTSDEDSYAAELYPNVAAVAAEYGDDSGKYANYLKEKEPEYPAEAWFLWNQPLSDSGLSASASLTGGSSAPTASSPSVKNADSNGAPAARSIGALTLLGVLASAVLLL